MYTHSILEEHVVDILRTYIAPDSTICIWVSGGVDSMTLLYLVDKTVKLLYRHCKISLVVCHYKHWIRKDAWEVDILRQVENSLVVERWEYQWDSTTEWALRQARYSWFESCVRKHSATLLLLWHTLNDRVESTLFGMSNWNTVTTILWIRQYTTIFSIPVLRPLLWLSKWMIYTYARANSIQRYEDHTNTETKRSKRNKIRKQLSLHHIWIYSKVDNIDIKILHQFYNVYTASVYALNIQTFHWINTKVSAFEVTSESDLQAGLYRLHIFWLSIWQRNQLLELVRKWSWWYQAKGRTFVTYMEVLYVRNWSRYSIQPNTTTTFTNNTIKKIYANSWVKVWKTRVVPYLKKRWVPYFLRELTILYIYEERILSYELPKLYSGQYPQYNLT